MIISHCAAVEVEPTQRDYLNQSSFDNDINIFKNMGTTISGRYLY